MKKFALILTALAVIVVGCKKFDEVGVNEPGGSTTSSTGTFSTITTMSDLNISSNFSWRTIKTVSVLFNLPEDGKLKTTRIYSPDGEKLYFKGYPEDGSRTLSTLVTVPTYIKSVLVKYGDGTDVPMTEVPVSDVNMTLNMAALKSGSDNECDNCDGKVTELTFKYKGNTQNAYVVIFQKKENDAIFEGTVNPNENFTFSGIDKKGTMGTEITIYVEGQKHVEIHTSCSQDIYVGQYHKECGHISLFRT